MRIFLITCAFLGFGLLMGSCSEYNKVLKSKDYDYKLRMAEQYFVKKKWSKAQMLYEELFPVFKGSPKFEDLYFKFAYCAYNQRSYMEASNLFKGFVDVFPNSVHAEEADFMNAMSFWKQSAKAELDQSNTIKAMGMMQTFINSHPGSTRNAEALKIIETGQVKLEQKSFDNAYLYYKLGHFRAAATAFTEVLNQYPTSPKADEYKLWVIRAFYRYAEMSIPDKQRERFEKVVSECEDFQDRYPESKMLKDAERFLSLSQSKIKGLSI